MSPIVIPNLKNLLAKRAGSFADEEESFKNFMNRSKNPPYLIETGRPALAGV